MTAQKATIEARLVAANTAAQAKLAERLETAVAQFRTKKAAELARVEKRRAAARAAAAARRLRSLEKGVAKKSVAKKPAEAKKPAAKKPAAEGSGPQGSGKEGRREGQVRASSPLRRCALGKTPGGNLRGFFMPEVKR